MFTYPFRVCVWLCVALLALTACASEPPAVAVEYAVTATPRAVVVTRTPAAPTSAATRAASEPTPMNEGRVTEPPVVPLTATSVWAPDPTPTYYPNPSVPAVRPAAAYRLRVPDSAMLLDVIDLAVKTGDDARGYYQWSNPVRPALDHDADALHVAVNRDLDRHYPAGLPGALDIDMSQSPWTDWRNSAAIENVRRASVLQALNRRGLPLTTARIGLSAGLFVQPYPLELDGDPGQEWLIDATWPEQYRREWLVLQADATGAYITVAHELSASDQWTAWDVAIETTYDLTGDGRSEVVLAQSQYWKGQHMGTVLVYAWDGQALSRLDTVHYNSLTLEAPTVSFHRATGAAFDEMRVTMAHQEGFGCAWEQVKAYTWVNGQAGLIESGAQRPETPVCRIASAMAHHSSWAPETKAQQLEIGLAQLRPEDVLSADYLALARLHLATAYASTGLDLAADRTLAGLVQAEGDGPYLEQLRVAYAAGNGSVLAVCAQVYGEAQAAGWQGLDADFEADISYGEQTRYFEDEPEVYAALMCPLPALLHHSLPRLRLDGSLAPEAALAAEGLTLAWAKPVNLDADASEEWLGVLEDSGQPRVIVLDRVGGPWRVIVAAQLYEPIEDFAFELHPGENDAPLRIVVAAQRRFSTLCCSVEDGPLYDVLVLGLDGDRFQTLRSRTLCGTLPELSTLLEPEAPAAPVFDELADVHDLSKRTWWARVEALRNLSGEPLDMVTALSSLEQQIAGEADLPSARHTLEATLAAAPQRDPAAQVVRARLLYLLGWSYELEGNSGQAIQAYVDLMRQFPASPWSWLAAARLEVVE